jgi:2-polyprenyl-3-methyl-5-hydroxy-6-metoxy-1,4-benzoquinol methylase
MEKIFTKIYEKKIWKTRENCPLSGAGSSIDYNKKYIKFLQGFIENIDSILDVGCGDWTFTKLIDFGKREYLGIDVVPSVISENLKKYSSKNIKFKQLDISQQLGEISRYELVIFKDILQHFSDQDIIKVLDYFINTIKPRYILIVNGKPVRNQSPNRNVNNRYHYAPLRFNSRPLSRYNIEPLFSYQYKEVGLITTGS